MHTSVMNNSQQSTNSYGKVIESAKLVNVFTPRRVSSSGQPAVEEVGACAWSSDGQYFAWSCGNRIVKVVSWNQQKHLKTTSGDGEKEVVGGTNDDVETSLTIDAGYNVRSIAFGSRINLSSSSRRRSSNSSSGDRNCPNQSPTSSNNNLIRFLVIEDLILATGLCNGRIRTWDVKTGCFKLEIIDHAGSVTDLSFATDGVLRLVSASLDGTLKVWDMEDDGNLLKTLKSKSKSLFGCSWSPDSRLLASVGDYKSVLLWDMEQYSLVGSFFGHQHNVSKCCFSPDGNLLATASFDTRVIIWDVFTGVPLQNLFHLQPPPSMIYAGGANGSYVRDVSFSADGQHVGTVCDDGFVRFWDICESEFPVLIAPVSGAMSCSFSANGSILAVGTIQGTARMYRSSVGLPSLQHLCRMSIRRRLSSNRLYSLNMLPTRLRKFLNFDDFQ